MYAWGQNNCGQLGSSISTNQVTPRQVNSVLGGKKVVCISCGQTSTMVVIENGEVYGFGNNGVGQLGIGNYANQTSPWQVGSLRGIVIGKSRFIKEVKEEENECKMGLLSNRYCFSQSSLWICSYVGAHRRREALCLGRKQLWPVGNRQQDEFLQTSHGILISS